MAKLTCNFISYTLMRSIDITVIIPSPTIPEATARNFRDSMGDALFRASFPNMPDPANHTKKEKYPVLYLFHGMGNDHVAWNSYTNIELFAEERNIAVVMISAENKSYVNQKCRDKFFDFIEEELPAFVTGMFPISSRPEDTYIAGLSMGGFGALLHGLTHPERYRAVGAFSPVIQLDPHELMNCCCEKNTLPEYDLYQLSRQMADGTNVPAIFIACGKNDPLYSSIEQFADSLTEMKLQPTWISVDGYGHEWRFWNLIVEQFMDTLPRTDYYVEKGKRQI